MTTLDVPAPELPAPPFRVRRLLPAMAVLGVVLTVLFGVFIGLLIIRVPVAFALGLACLPILLIEPRLSAMMLAQETFNAYNSFILLAVKEPGVQVGSQLATLKRNDESMSAPRSVCTTSG